MELNDFSVVQLLCVVVYTSTIFIKNIGRWMSNLYFEANTSFWLTFLAEYFLFFKLTGEYYFFQFVHPLYYE